MICFSRREVIAGMMGTTFLRGRFEKTPGETRAKWNISKEAAALHEDALVWDCHVAVPHGNPGRVLPQLSRYRDSGVDVVQINIGYDAIPWPTAVRTIAALRYWLLARPDHFVLGLSISDILRARRQGKLAVTFNIEGAATVQHQISMIPMFYDLGVRWMSIVYNLNNKAGGGCHDDDPGLTDLGRRVVTEMARVGMIACCSHTGYRTAMDVFEHSPNPVILSHSNPRALKDHARNVPDEVMKACARTGGVMGINGIGIFLGDVGTRTESIVRHIDYAVQLIGADHVGIGLDYSFGSTAQRPSETKRLSQPHELLFGRSRSSLGSTAKFFPPGNEYEAQITNVQPEQIPEITEGLLKLGYAETDVRKVLGGNFLRIAKQVWR